MPITGSVVLCDDILGLIFNGLPVKDLYRFQRVSQQFCDCTEEALQKTRSLAIGCDCRTDNDPEGDILIKSITGSIDLMAIDVSPAFLDKPLCQMESFLTKFRAVKRLYLKEVSFTFKEMAITVKQLPRLEEIYFFDFYIKSQKRRVQTSRQWADLWVNVKHIAIAGLRHKHVTLMANIIRQLASLQSLEVYDMPIASDLLVDCLPANIRSLKVMRDTFDTESIESLTTKCRQIQELSLSSHIEKDSDFNNDNEFGEWFLIICDRLKNLKRLTIPLAQISSQEFAGNIKKLSKLRHLAIESDSDSLMVFDTTSMTPMASLRSLSLYGIKCSPEMWSKFIEVMPNLRRLSLDAINCHIDCVHSLDESKECLKMCFERFMKSVANHRNVKVLTLGYLMNGFDDNILETLHLFKHLDQLCIHMEAQYLIRQSHKFVTQCLADRNRVFRLGLLCGTTEKDAILRRLNEPDVQMPAFLRIIDCGDCDQYIQSSVHSA